MITYIYYKLPVAIGTDTKITKLTSFLHVGGPEKDHLTTIHRPLIP